jgi:excinuclease ABC subunit B
LREGLDLPEVSLVAILDADKQGFLRSATALIQTIGRAARHVEGTVVMYADTMTDAMRRAIDETDRRRAKQAAHNAAHGITPRSISTSVHALTDDIVRVAEKEGAYVVPEKLERAQLVSLARALEADMRDAAERLEFERAAALRDQVREVREALAARGDAPSGRRERRT